MPCKQYLFSLQCQKFIQKDFQLSWPSAIDLNKSVTLAALQGLIHRDLSSDVSLFIWQLLTLKGSIVFFSNCTKQKFFEALNTRVRILTI